MSVGGQSNAPQTPFSPNYRERRSVQPRGPGNAYTQRPGQQPNPQQPAQLQPAPQPNQGGQGYGNPFGGGFGGGYSSPFGGGFGGGYSTPFSDYGGGFGGGYGQPRQYGGGFGQPNQPPPGMELNPNYIDRFAGGMAGTLEFRPTDNKFRPIQQPQPQTGGDIQYAGGSPGFYEAQLQAQQRQGGQGYGNQFGGGYGGGYSSPYMSSPMMGGLASLFGGMQGGGFQGMFNSPSQAQRYDPYSFNPQADAQRQQQQMFMDKEANTTDYQRLMRRKNSASSGPYVNPLTGAVGGVNPFTQVSDYEIAQSLGLGDSGISDMRVRSPKEYEQEDKTRQARAKSYLDSIGYGTEGFDSSKYEVRRQPRSPSPGLSGIFSGLA